MKILKGNKGLTLVEIVIALAILGIIAVSFSTLFTSGFIGIAKSGDKAVAAYASQGEMTDKILDGNDFISTQYLNINFIGGPSFNINVGIIQSEEEVKGSTSIMTSFIPVP